MELRLRDLNRLENKPYISIKDPISTLTHFIGFVAAIFLTPVLLSRAGMHSSDLKDLAGLSVYCLSMIVLYGASSAHHAFVLPEGPSRILRKLDHISIFLLIAGTYTPLCLSVLDPVNGMQLLKAIWLIAIIGILMKAFWINCPKYVSSLTYILMGWLALWKIIAVYQAMSSGAFLWLLAGGIFYTAGGIFYALKISFSRDWSEHEVFHLFVLLGTLCHYILICLFVA
ncbi:MAG: hemolysin III family protein [Erysipelotrichaceae bacterium]|nr:hemolysin III family protein [Erysipelotrichaceae bacterium]